MKFKPMYLLLSAALASLSLSALAFDSFTVRDIRVEGLQRTDAGTVFNYLGVKVGENFDDAKASQAIRSLFATGFFDDVRIEVDKDILVVTVDERPTISQININGAKLIEKDQIKKAFQGQNLADSQIFQQEALDAAINELKQQYYARGRYSVEIKATVTKLERNRVGIQVDISEGDVALIKGINFVGNTVYSDSELLRALGLTTSNWITWYTKTDQYSKQKFAADLEQIKSMYLDNGYIKFAIESTAVALSEDKTEMFLTVNINEGAQYKVGKVTLSSTLAEFQEPAKALLLLKTGQVYSREDTNKSGLAISNMLGNHGYAFANVNPLPEIDEESKTVNFTVMVDPGKKTNIRRINVYGNSLTRDEVIRRELRQMESAEYDLSKVKRSKERLQNLGYFSEVNIDTPIVPDAVDQVDMNVNVVEQKTGNFNFGVGYGQSEGVIFQVSVSQANFLGTGKRFSVDVNTSTASKVYSLSMRNPYATTDGVAFGWSLYQKNTDPNSVNLGDYSTDSKGLSLNFGMPTSDYNSLGLSLNYENLKIHANQNSPTYVNDYLSKYGAVSDTYSAVMSWASDSRDSATFPTKGWYRKINADVAIPPSELTYYKLSAQSQFFYSFNEKSPVTFVWNIEAGYGRGYGSGELPFYKNYFAGGVNSVRGYKSGSLGPRDNNGDSMGGQTRFVNNFELYSPLPNMKDDKTMRLSVFLDAGNVWGDGQVIDSTSLRYSTGAAFTWISPVGPIKLIYAYPLNAKPGDSKESFQFQLGQVF
ncbi:outer membrane protein assembly factor BamA [Chitinibacter bivalviorum]|uniref:Outer membrane protein assembly factor BamA n=1 Tax=Chitinibacter bivalviorum TaxID=2739434 RepID=A0A7H9BH12_9NEIS|nr:outer membrane protein assembly factor BamA [Chitinibacter bivalviorum]QLG87885.1 outer membrane protein assembly factor BamA [Chitinibacter bivalviorum]